MRILAVDDERIPLELLTEAIRAARPDAEVFPFSDPAELLAFAETSRADAAFLDIQMYGMTGLELAKRLKEIAPDINIIFVTGYTQYTAEALRLRASGYVMKPPTKEKIEAELEDLRRPVREERDEKRLQVRCFGNFEMFVGGKPLRFEYARSKEVFAYLVDRQGATANTGELCGILWEDDSYSRKVQLRKYVADLCHTLERAGAGDAFLKARNSFAASKDAFDCDYYRFLQGDAEAVNAYHGEYMAQYGWAEMTLGSLEMARG